MRNHILTALVISLAVGGAACSRINLGPAELPDDRDMGSPEVYTPQGPAEASHRYHQKNELLFDARLGLYLVVAEPGVYFSQEQYYRNSSEGWLTASELNGPWLPVDPELLPPGLAATAANPKTNNNSATSGE